MKDEIDLRNRMIADAAAQIAVYERELAATHTDRNVAHAELSALYVCFHHVYQLSLCSSAVMLCAYQI